MSDELSGKVAIVTGGMVGIGLASAAALSAQGARVAIGARRAGHEDLVAAVHKAAGADVLTAPLDVQSTESVAAFTGKVAEALGGIDILVNSAGIGVHQTVCGHDEEDWNAVIDTNLTGPFRMIRACLPGMIDRGWGRIVNIASTAARSAMPDYAAYCASKSGLLGLTRAVALEGAPHGVTCTAVSPTWVETDMLRASAAEMAANEGTDTDEIIARFSAANPQNRLVQASEIGALVAFLCSENAKGLTMEDIQINAGANW